MIATCWPPCPAHNLANRSGRTEQDIGSFMSCIPRRPRCIPFRLPCPCIVCARMARKFLKVSPSALCLWQPQPHQRAIAIESDFMWWHCVAIPASVPACQPAVAIIDRRSRLRSLCAAWAFFVNWPH